MRLRAAAHLALEQGKHRRLAWPCAAAGDNGREAQAARHHQARRAKHLRKMLIQGARASMPTLRWSDTRPGAWLRALLARAYPNTALVALAAKMARIVWALLDHGRSYEVMSVPAMR